MKAIYYGIALCCIFVSMSAISDDNESKKIRRLVQEKDIVSLESLMPAIRRHGDFKLLEVEMEEENGILIYEIELLDKKGRVYEIRYDAKTGQEMNND